MNVSCEQPLPWLPKPIFLLQIYVENKALLYLFMVEPLTKEQSHIRQTTRFFGPFSMNIPFSATLSCPISCNWTPHQGPTPLLRPFFWFCYLQGGLLSHVPLCRVHESVVFHHVTLCRDHKLVVFHHVTLYRGHEAVVFHHRFQYAETMNRWSFISCYTVQRPWIDGLSSYITQCWNVRSVIETMNQWSFGTSSTVQRPWIVVHIPYGWSFTTLHCAETINWWSVITCSTVQRPWIWWCFITSSTGQIPWTGGPSS